MEIKDSVAEMDSANEMQNVFDKALIESQAQTLLAHLSGLLKEQDIHAYLVGGFVRDVLLGRETSDIDIAVDVDVLTIAPRIAESLRGKFVLLDEVNRIGRIVIKDWTIDVASFEGRIENDLARRDFTIDAIAVDLNQLASDGPDTQLIDLFGGRLDLDLDIIRPVTDTALKAVSVTGLIISRSKSSRPPKRSISCVSGPSDAS